MLIRGKGDDLSVYRVHTEARRCINAKIMDEWKWSGVIRGACKRGQRESFGMYQISMSQGLQKLIMGGQ